LKEEDFEVKTYREDDGENRAGMTIVDTLAHGAVDVVVVVSRWFGGKLMENTCVVLNICNLLSRAGTMLGPRRFNDISKVTLEALYRFRDAEELQSSRKTLISKDDEVATLLSQLNRLEGKLSTTSPEKPDYEVLDLPKAKRLLVARDMRIKNLKSRIRKIQAEEAEELPDLPISKTSKAGT